MTIKFSKKHLKEFEKMGIKVIYLFGSYGQGHPHQLSDVDIGIVFEKPERYKENTLKVYNKLYDIFTDVLPRDYLYRRFKLRKHEFDIVFLQFGPISLQFRAVRDGKVLYEKDEELRFRYQEKVMTRNADLEYFHNMRYRAILERI